MAKSVVTEVVFGIVLGVVLVAMAVGLDGIMTGVEAAGILGFFTLIDTGLGAWLRSLIKKDSTRFLTPLAYPYFLWFPITLFFSFRLINTYLPLPWTIAIFTAIISLCTVLWTRGRALERKAMNPLKGLLPIEIERRYASK